ncbi:MAG: dinitrogenase iron-molybdenum cofactor biosynthesis domain-containing protein [Desulfobulbaceae bacterium]|nr:MAG: dinitrogenase iron-molybdenum cofactor biosynthesis domain-containing protein [Desulfobulbaceae bacterium]
MKISMTVWENRVSPVFDSARSLLIAEIMNGCIANRTNFEVTTCGTLVHKLLTSSVDLLICGAISQEAATLIENAEIEIVAFIAGNQDQILEAYLQNRSLQPFTMPGCCYQPYSCKLQGLQTRAQWRMK